jgi:hypothetical protein
MTSKRDVFYYLWYLNRVIWHDRSERLLKVVLLMLLVLPVLEGFAGATSPPHIRRVLDAIPGQETAAVYILYSHSDLSASDLPGAIQRSIRGETDFIREAAVVVFAGTRPTGGYGLTVEDTTISDTTFTITIGERGPAPDAIVTQALTYPAIALIIADPPGEVVVIPAGEPMTR